MKLIECYVENFGKLTHFSYKFDAGMNVFCRENGWGKSTFAGFIKAMFYGLTTNRSLDAGLNERVRYLPWQGGSCGGTLTFSVGEEIYRVERTFGAKESQDTFALYDCKTGLASTAYSEHLGEELFNIDAVGYERSTFISERLTSDATRSDYTGIQAKLVDMNDLSDFGIAEKALEKRRKFYYVQGGRGAIAETSTKLTAKRAELAEAEVALQKTNELNRRARALDEERTKLDSMLRAVHSRIDSSLSHRTEEALAAHKLNLEESLARAKEATATCRAYLSAKTATPQQLEEQSHNWRTIKDTKPADISASRIPAWLPFALFICGIGCVGAGIAVGVALNQLLLLAVLGVVGLILLFSGVAMTFSRHRAQETARIAAASRAEYDRLAASLAAFLGEYPIVMADPSLHDDGERLWAIRTKMVELHRCTIAEEEATLAYTDFRSKHPALFSDTPSSPDEEVTAAKADEAVLMKEIDRVREERASCEREIARYASAAGRYTTCAQEIIRLEEIKKSQEKSLDIIQMTQQFLANARTALTSRYLDDIQTNFRAYMRILTEVDRDSVFSDEYSSETYTVTSDFCVNMTKFGKTRAATTLSRGGRDLVALCLRFAITDALFEGRKPPLILDDPFINLDDSKIGAAMELLARVAKERQIFYVSCHSSRA